MLLVNIRSDGLWMAGDDGGRYSVAPDTSVDGGFFLWFGARPEVTAELRALVEADSYRRQDRAKRITGLLAVLPPRLWTAKHQRTGRELESATVN